MVLSESVMFLGSYLPQVKHTFTGRGTSPLGSSSCCGLFIFLPIASSFLLRLLLPVDTHTYSLTITTQSTLKPLSTIVWASLTWQWSGARKLTGQLKLRGVSLHGRRDQQLKRFLQARCGALGLRALHFLFNVHQVLIHVIVFWRRRRVCGCVWSGRTGTAARASLEKTDLRDGESQASWCGRGQPVQTQCSQLQLCCRGGGLLG